MVCPSTYVSNLFYVPTSHLLDLVDKSGSTPIRENRVSFNPLLLTALASSPTPFAFDDNLTHWVLHTPSLWQLPSKHPDCV